jgi:hypothetical protein
VPDDLLRLGPLLRHVDETTAAIWVEVSRPAEVAVHAANTEWRAPTFTVHGHHYALVEVDGLQPGSAYDYTVAVDGVGVWPRPGDGPFPASQIATLDPGRDLNLLFGSCRTSVPHDEEGNRTHGVDALRAFALDLVENPDARRRPDLALFLGDQVYADETPEKMREFIASRRSLDEPPWEELKDYSEYCYLYELAWTDPVNRWILSTVPSAMIFDDHDIRDDWNTSQEWRETMAAKSWWRDRIVGGLASYWVYQHLGNLSPAERAADPMWKHVLAARAEDHTADLGGLLDDHVERADKEPGSYRWSYARDIGRVRILMVDTRAARELASDARSMLAPSEMKWLDAQLQGGDIDHLLFGTSLPFLLSRGLHHLEAWNEAVAHGAWGDQLARWGERVRRAVDLEHWAAFEESFAEVARMVVDLADGNRGAPPGTITFLSGDVHHSYVAEAQHQSRTRILQAVCSPIRNPLPRAMRFATAISAYGLAAPLGTMAARSAKVPDPPFHWGNLAGPWFDNNIATLRAVGRDLEMEWHTGVVADGRPDQPTLDLVADLQLRGDDLSSRVVRKRDTWPSRAWNLLREARHPK